MTDKELLHALHEPFHPSAIRWRPGRVKDNRAMALAYLDARAVENRLDQVFGVAGWQDDYQVLDHGCVMCKLSACVNGEWVTKVDVGGPSEQPDAGDKVKAAFCLPLDAMALTPSGWSTYDRLSVGDSILGYDLASGLCRWTTATAVNVFEAPCDLLSLSSKSFNASCTPNHRWVVHRRDGGISMKEMCKIDSRDKIVVAAPAEGGSHQLTTREAAIIGWLATDGGIHVDNSRRLFNAFIHQSKVVTRDSIRSLLGEDAVEHITPPGQRKFPGHDTESATMERSAFRIKTTLAKILLARAGLWDGESVHWDRMTGLVTKLSVEARNAMFKSMMDGDGQHSCSGQLKFGKKRKPGVMESFEVLATLKGVALGTLHSTSQDGKVPLRTLRRNPHTWAKCLSIAPAVPEPCWCPTTELGTWVTMWSGQITITGNSDALKRAAIKFGIGRYLYQLPSQWVDYDSNKKRFTGKPQLPAWAVPNSIADKLPEDEPEPDLDQQQEPARYPISNGTAKPAVPQNGQELFERLSKKDEAMATAKTIARGALLAYVRSEGMTLGFSDDIMTWGAEQAQTMFELAKEFVKQRERGLITHAELDEIMREIDKRDVAVESILEYFRIRTLSNLPAAQLPVLRERLGACKLRALESVPIN